MAVYSFHSQCEKEVQDTYEDDGGVEEVGDFTHPQVAEGTVRLGEPFCLIYRGK